MDLGSVHSGFSSELDIVGGGRLRGQISEFKTELGTLEYVARLLKVSPRSPARAGQVVVDPEGLRYILTEHMGSYFNGSLTYNTLRMIRADQELPWSRQTTAKDPITGLAKGTTTQDLGSLNVNVKPINLERRAKMKPESKVEILSGQELKVGDRLGDYSVTFVDHVLGVWLAEAS